MIASPKSLGKPPIKDSKSANSCNATPAHLKKVGLSFRNWSDSKILWNSLPPAICNLGKVGEFVIVKDLIFTVCSDVSTDFIPGCKNLQECFVSVSSSCHGRSICFGGRYSLYEVEKTCL